LDASYQFLVTVQKGRKAMSHEEGGTVGLKNDSQQYYSTSSGFISGESIGAGDG
jgi:hypothetical protein